MNATNLDKTYCKHKGNRRRKKKRRKAILDSLGVYEIERTEFEKK